jgi:hypothetical protein
MQAEPSKAEPPKRKRRRFQFRLRTLMIGVTLLAGACWGLVALQGLIRERDAALQSEATMRHKLDKAQAREAYVARLLDEARAESAKRENTKP